MTNGNDVTQTTKHTNLFNSFTPTGADMPAGTLIGVKLLTKKFTPYSVPPAHAPASVLFARQCVRRAGARE